MALSKPATILIVEDEPAQLELLKYNFEKEGYNVLFATQGEEGLLIAVEHLPDLIVLDWMIPNLSGIEVCRQLKRGKDTRDIPIMMLTARGEESDKVRGLDTGADDYMVKPYSIAELLARARAVIRRNSAANVDQIVEYADVTLDPVKIKVTRGNETIKLGPTEFRLLSLLISRPGRVWTRSQLIDRIWDHDADIDERTVDVHVGRLRKAMAQKDKPDLIRTVRSMGYSIDSDDF